MIVKDTARMALNAAELLLFEREATDEPDEPSEDDSQPDAAGRHEADGDEDADLKELNAEELAADNSVLPDDLAELVIACEQDGVMKGMKEVMCCEHVKGRFFDTHKSKFKNYKRNRSLMNDDFEYYKCCSLLLLVADRDLLWSAMMRKWKVTYKEAHMAARFDTAWRARHTTRVEVNAEAEVSGGLFVDNNAVEATNRWIKVSPSLSPSLSISFFLCLAFSVCLQLNTTTTTTTATPLGMDTPARQRQQAHGTH